MGLIYSCVTHAMQIVTGVQQRCMQCVDPSSKRAVATWTDEEMTLRVDDRFKGAILDRFVMTCYLHIWWIKHLKKW